MRLPLRAKTRQQRLTEIRSEPLGEFFTFWTDIPQGELKALDDAVREATTERDLQAHFERYPQHLICQLGGGHGRWVIPQQKLGSEHVTDFMIADKHSFGREWFAVELESPKAKMFTRAGNPTKELTHAIRQIQDWRSWLTKNADYASRGQDQKGLGLEGIHPELSGYIFIGRRSDTSSGTNELRRRILIENRIEVHSYDWLVDAVAGRVNWHGTALGQLEREALLHGQSRRLSVSGARVSRRSHPAI